MILGQMFQATMPQCPVRAEACQAVAYAGQLIARGSTARYRCKRRPCRVSPCSVRQSRLFRRRGLMSYERWGVGWHGGLRQGRRNANVRGIGLPVQEGLEVGIRMSMTTLMTIMIMMQGTRGKKTMS
nr:hypothetical protein CFP56_62762 [Quercus suber]